MSPKNKTLAGQGLQKIKVIRTFKPVMYSLEGMLNVSKTKSRY
jgi:hypothetical protein